MTRAAKVIVLWAGGIAVGAGSCMFSPHLPAGKISCSTRTACPSDFPLCVDNVCSSNGVTPSTDARDVMPATDVAGPDAADHEDTPAIDVATDADAAGETMAADAQDVAADVAADVLPEAGADTGMPACPAADLTTGLLVFLPLDDGGQNPDVDDQAPGQLDAFVNKLDTGSTWVAGRFGSALSLNGGSSGAWITVGGAPPSLSLNRIVSGFSFSLWVKFPKGKINDGVLISRRAEGAKGYLYELSVTNGRLEGQIYTTNGNHSDVTSNQTLLTDGNWMHIGAAYAMADGFQLYINGVPVGKDPMFGMAIGDETTALLIGGAEDPQALFPTLSIVGQPRAALDDVAIYTTALSSTAFRALACGARPMP